MKTSANIGTTSYRLDFVREVVDFCFARQGMAGFVPIKRMMESAPGPTTTASC